MEPLTADELNNLQRLAERVTGAEPWYRDVDLVGSHDTLSQEDAAYIAAANPATLLRLLAQVREAEWQPIATAPKDVEVWACGGELHPYVAKLIEVDEFIGVREGSRLAMRWHNLSANRYSRPTHWQPLPPPPAREGSEG